MLRCRSLCPGGQRGEGKREEEAARGEDSSGGGWGSQEPHPPPEEPQTGFQAELSPLLLDLETSGPQRVPFQIMHMEGAMALQPLEAAEVSRPEAALEPASGRLGKPKRLLRLG